MVGVAKATVLVLHRLSLLLKIACTVKPHLMTTSINPTTGSKDIMPHEIQSYNI